MTAASLESDEEFLALAGGWVLLVFGLALVVLAFVFKADADVASPALVIGAACVVLAVVLSRAEGILEFGSTGFKVGLRRLRRKAKADSALSKKQKEEVLAAAAERLSERASVVSPDYSRARVASLYATTRDEVVAFEERIRVWLTREGWAVSRGDDRGFDFVAVKAGEPPFLVEAKFTTQPVTRGLLLRWLPKLLQAERSFPDSCLGLFISARDVTEAGAEAAAGTTIAIYVETGNGFVRVNP